MLAARIDRLPPEDKRLLQVASVVGKDVPFGLLQAIAELPDEALRRALADLQAAEFLYETSLFPDFEYTFKHALTHEVTYGGLLQERRRSLHARIVDAIETLQPDRLGEQIERLAHHALRGELREKAVHYLRQAGGKAAVRSVLPDAQGWFEQALGVLEALPESQSTLEQAFEIRLELRPVLGQLGEFRRVLERLREAEALAERLNDDHRQGLVWALMTNIHSVFGELDAMHLLGDIATHPDRFDAESGEAHYRKALALAEPRGMRPLVAHCHLGLGKHYRRTGKSHQAQEHLSTATTMYRAMDMQFWWEQAEAELRQ